MEKTFSNVLKALLFLTALTPLVITKLTPFPFVAGKTFFYRGLIELTLLVFAVYLLAVALKGGLPEFWKSMKNKTLLLFKNKLFLFVALFIFSALLSTIFAVNSYRSFFGDIERGEGFLGLLHYFIFMVFAVTLFKKEDWVKFFKFSLVVLVVVIFYAWLQYFGITDFPFALGASSQPGSFTGNPAFFSSYLIVSLALTAITYFSSAQKTFWRYFSVIIAVLSIVTLFITQIRGAILGVLVGAVFLFGYLLFKEERFRRAGIIALVVLLAFVLAFWLTRGADFWQNVPGLKRFANASFDSPSVSTRLIALDVSWDAFKEKPIFGWGPENYSIAYNKHYDPAYSLYAEDWFDRAHNKIAEVGVVQGGVGLLLYLGVFASLFSMLFKKKPADYVFVAAALAAYFVQNLFLFDNVTSYIPFFAVLGFLIAEASNIRTSDVSGSSTSLQEVELQEIKRSNLQKLASVIFAVIVIAVSLYSLYSYIYVPYVQSERYVLSTRTRVGDKILAATDSFFSPYTFVQLTIRSQFHDFLYNNNLFRNQQFRPLIDRSLAALEESMEKEPYDPRHFARLIEGYNELAKQEERFFEQSLTFAERALALSPRRQGLHSHLAFALAGEERYEEAIAVDRRSVELTPTSAKSHLNLGITLALAAEDEDNKGTPLGEAYKEESLKELDRALELGYTLLGGGDKYEGDDLTNTQFLLFIESDLKNLTTIYRGFDRLDKVFEVVKVALHEKFGTARNEDFIHDGIVLARHFRDKGAVIEYARRLKEVNPLLADDMDVIIDLAEKEDWEILDSL